jgi:hypothetical protein
MQKELRIPFMEILIALSLTHLAFSSSIVANLFKFSFLFAPSFPIRSIFLRFNLEIIKKNLSSDLIRGKIEKFQSGSWILEWIPFRTNEVDY